MGLLDILDSDQGRLGVGLLAAAGPSLTPMGFGQRLQQGLGYVQQQRDADMQAKLRQAQLEETVAQAATRKAALDRQNQMIALAGRFAQPARPAQGATGDVNAALPGDMQIGAQPAIPAKPAGFDFSGYANALASIDPMASLGIQQALQKETPINKLDVKDFTPASVAKFAQTKNYADLVRMDKLHFADTGGAVTALNQFTGQPVASTPVTGNPYKDLLVAGANGQLTPNSPLIGAKTQIARAGAPNTTVSIAGPENRYNADIGAGLAKDALAAVDAARSAPEVVSNARMIRKAVASGAIVGTGAEARLAVQKALETAGLVGEGKAANTQALMAGLGKVTLSSIKTSGLGGGNGFTDKDRAFLESAASGTIADTPANLLRVADLSERIATAAHQKGTSVIKRWQGDKALRAVAQDTQIDPIPAQDSAPAQPAAQWQWNPQTKKIEKVQ